MTLPGAVLFAPGQGMENGEMVTILIVTDKGKSYCMSKDIETAETCLKSINKKGKMDVVYPNRRKTPSFSYGDIRRVWRICVSN